MTESDIPVAVDLDGTLIKSDLLLESYLLLIKQNFLLIFVIPFWLLKGKAHLKYEIARRVTLEPQFLPYNQAVLEYLDSLRAQGRPLILATASHSLLANKVAEHLGLFNEVIATEDQRNLSGSAKAQALIQRYGEQGFDYIGNHEIDLQVWRHSRQALVVGDEALANQARAACKVSHHFSTKPASVKTLIKALRVHQWVKNGLIFVPIFTAHQIYDGSLLFTCLLGFLAFSLCASSVYFLNDLLDLADDRNHATKCFRPFAAGTLDLKVGILGAPLLLLLAGIICLFLPYEFFLVLVGYYVLTLAYSFKLKQLVMVDVVTLASLYTVRIVAGAALIGVFASFWLLSFSMFVFLSLAIVKRYTELMRLKLKNSDKKSARGYQVDDLELLSSLGGASGYISVLVFALYINSPEIRSMYTDPYYIWPACIVLLYWISRLWIIAHRGQMNDDPIVFALKDFASIVCGALITFFMVLAL